MNGYRERIEFQYNLAVLSAWYAAKLSRVKKIPPLKGLLYRKPKTVKTQTWQQQLAIAKQWVAAFKRYDEQKAKR